jgi:pyruvate dehydrogenase E2 component (dihydrolipoamide acetyltransferase)
MAIAITIPRLGWNMEQGIFLGWLKSDGESIRAGEPLFTLEGDKATEDVEANDGGILRIAAAAPRAGEQVAVGAVIGYLLGAGDEMPAEHATVTVRVTQQPAAAAAGARSGTGEGITGRLGAPRTIDTSDRPRISPLARRLARELGVDWTRLRGSGCTGRIRKVDILAAVRRRPVESVVSQPAPRDDGASSAQFVPVSSRRRAIARRMLESSHSTAPVTLTTTADAANLVNLRAQFKAASTQVRDVPGYTDFVVKLTATALRDHPLLHARWDEDRLVIPDEPHVGIAVDTDEGLLVPVIRGAAGLTLGQITAQVRDLTQRARERRLRAEEMQGGTITITNLGSLGVETFTPIINPPECAVLGIGRITRAPVMVGDRVVGQDQLSLSLTFDHRIVDGAPAARFLRSLVQLIENPGPWLIP